MRRSLAVIMAAALVAVMSACTAPPPPRRHTGNCDPGWAAAFDAWAKAGFSGSIAISKDGGVECLAAYGSADDAAGRPNTPETVFAIGSITKAFTAAAVLDLADHGRLSLDDRAGELLPRLRGPVARATVRQLLLHTSGLTGSHGDDYRPLDRDAAVKTIGGLGLAFKPGSGYLYSNAGYTLLALIVEEVSGGYRDHLTSTILRLPGGRIAGGFWNGEPAAPGPRAVGYLEDGPTRQMGGFGGPHWALEGNGGLAMTVRDLATWTHALFAGRLVSPASVNLLTGPGHALDDGVRETPGWVAYDASRYGRRFLTTAGGGGDVGHNAVVAWIPGDNRVVAIASNKPRVSAEALLQAVGPALLAGRPLPAPSAPPSASGDLTAIVGTYRLDTGGTFDVSTSQGKVRISADGASALTAMFPANGDVSGNEQRVLALLEGRTQEGRKERASLESAFGPVTGVTLAGTVSSGGELRTYVTLTTRAKRILGWYAVNDQGGIQAVSVPAPPPELTFVPAGGGRYRPDDPAGTGPDVSVAFTGGDLVITTPGGSLRARPAHRG